MLDSFLVQTKVSSPLLTKRGVRSMQDPHYYACKDVEFFITNFDITQMRAPRRKKTKGERRLVSEESLSSYRCNYKVKEIKESEEQDISSGS